MNPETKPFLSWLGHSRRERRSAFILLLILTIVIAIRYVVPDTQDDLIDISGSLATPDSGKQSAGNILKETSSLFTFDPNSASFDNLTNLGLSEKQARTIISYRNRGGRFRQPGDLRKIYGIDEASADRIMPYVSIPGDTGKIENKKANHNFQDRKPEKTELNKADSAKLDALPGIGPVLSARIVKYRELLGGFVSVDQLKEVYGIKESTFLLISERIYADSSTIRFIRINDPGFNKLSRHPYLDKYDLLAILKYRELKGKITNIEELITNKILTEDKARRIYPYLKF